VRALAEVPQPGPVSLDSAGRVLVGSLDGTIRRYDPATGRLDFLYPR
jgi:hypothetical protein